MRTYILTVITLFLFSLSSNAQCPTSNRQGIHVVQPNENLYRIAQRYNVTLLQIGEWNKLTIGQVIPMCSELKVADPATIPTEFSAESFTERSTSNNTFTSFGIYQKQSGKQHTVQPGETLAGIAELYGYTEKRFREINPIPVGQDVTAGSILLSTDCDCARISYNEKRPTDYGLAPTRRLFESTHSTTTSPVNNNIQPGKQTGASTKPILTGVTGNTPPPTSSTINNIAPLSNDVAPANYLSPEEKAMLNEINFMRSNPRGYIQYVNQYVAEQKNNNGFSIDDRVVKELNSELRALTAPLSQLRPTQCIFKAAQDHGRDLLQQGKTDHQGSDGSWPWDRVRRACPDMQDGNENLVGGPASVREAVIILLLDDGIPNRGHRKTLLNPRWKYAACFKIGQVGVMPNCWVQKFGY